MPKKLLLVEDSLTIQNVVQTTFAPADFQVIVASDAQEGLAKLHAVTPDIVLADATMADMDGFQLCQHIRETKGYEHIPVLLLTSSFAAYDAAHGHRVGVTDYLAKPFDASRLLTVVQQLMTRAPVSAAPPQTFPVETVPLECMLTASKAAADPDPEEVEVVSTAPTTSERVYQTLGQMVAQTIQGAIDTHLATMLQALAPQILEEVHKTVCAKVPELLEVLLQREIEKLKQAVAEDGDHATPAESIEPTAE
jgi:DNA-binding response OmpR family regulator